MEYIRPIELVGITSMVQFDSGKLYVTVNHDGENVVEIFVKGIISNAVGMLSSKLLQTGSTVREVVLLLKKITGTHYLQIDGQIATSPEQAVAICIERVQSGLAEETSRA